MSGRLTAYEPWPSLATRGQVSRAGVSQGSGTTMSSLVPCHQLSMAWATVPPTNKCRQSHPGCGCDEWPHSNEMETSRRVAGRRSVADRPSPCGGNKKDRPAARGRQGRNYTFTLPFSYCDGAHTSPLGPGWDTAANFQHELWD